jgi:lipid-A-disaccharide synthase
MCLQTAIAVVSLYNMKTQPRIFLAAGEASGDRYGALLIEQLRAAAPNAAICGIGGPRMAAAGMTLHHDMMAHATMGLAGALVGLRKFARLLESTKGLIAREHPDVFVPIDNPGFNLHLAQFAKRAGVPVCYYVSPQVWAWGAWRTQKIVAAVDRMLVILPFEEKIFREAGADTRYVGHPMLDYLAAAQMDGERLKKLKAEPLLIGLMPGSRRREVSQVFVPIAGAAAEIARHLPIARFAVALAEEAHAEMARGVLAKAGMPLERVDFLVGKTFEVMQASRVCLAVSGTVTLELSYFHRPMVIVYRSNALGRVMRPVLIKTPFIGLPNIIAGREIVPEFFLFNAGHQPIVPAAMSLLENTERWDACRANLETVMAQMGAPGASQRAATAVLELVR